MKTSILAAILLGIAGLSVAHGAEVASASVAYAAISVDDQFIARPALPMGPNERSILKITDMAGIEHAVEVSFPSSATSIQFARIALEGNPTRLTPVETYPESAETRFLTPEGAEIRVMLSVVAP